MTSSTVWDLTEASVALLGRLPILLQTWGLIAAAQAVVSGAGTIVHIIGGPAAAAAIGSFGMGILP